MKTSVALLILVFGVGASAAGAWLVGNLWNIVHRTKIPTRSQRSGWQAGHDAAAESLP